MQEHQTAVRIDVPFKPLYRIEAPTRPPMEARAGLVVENWIGMPGVVPEQIRTEQGESTTIVLADDVEFRDRSYIYSRWKNAPKHVILIANTIRLMERVWIIVDGNVDIGRTLEENSGGHVTIIARRLICEKNGSLSLASDAGRGGVLGRPSGHGGNIIVVVEQAYLGNVQERFKAIVDEFAWQGGLGEDLYEWHKDAILYRIARNIDDSKARREFEALLKTKYTLDEELFEAMKRHHRLHMEKLLQSSPLEICVTRTNMGSYGAPKGHDGALHTANRIKDIITLDPQHGAFVVSRWVIGLLEQLSADINSAVLREDRAALIRLFRKVNELVRPDNYPIIPDHLAFYRTITESLTAAKRQNLSALWTHPITVHPPGTVPRALDVFIEARDLKSTLAPTEALVRRRSVGGRRVLGLLEFHPERPAEIVLTTEVELTVDPWLASLATTELARADEEYAGIFTNWVLDPRAIQDVGIKASTVEAVAPTVLHVSLTLDTQSASLTMFKLASSGGLPLHFDWEYRHDSEIKGEWFGPSLSLLRRTDPDLALMADGRVTNTSRTALTLEYLRLGADDFHPLQPALTIPPGMTVALPLPAGTDWSKVVIPPEAVVYSGLDPFNLDDHFLILNGAQFLETFTVTNLLGPDDRRGGALNFVEVHLVYLGGAGGGASDVSAGPYRLASRGALGAETTVSFLKSRQGDRRVRLSGTAVYAGGSLQTLTPTTVSELTVKITEDMLPPLR